MTSKATLRILKYFNFGLNITSLFMVSCNFKKFTVKNSNLKCFYMSFFTIYYVLITLYKFVNIKEYARVHYHQEGAVFINTMIVETVASIIMVVLTAHQQIVKRKMNKSFFELLMKSYKASDMNYELFDGSLGYQMAVVGFISDFGIFFILWSHLRLSIRNDEDFITLNVLKNPIFSSLFISFHYEIVTRYSIALSFFVDLIRKLVKELNKSLEESLQSIEISKDSERCIFVMRRTCQWYSTISSIVRSFEKNFAFVILLFQCLSFLIGLNQLFYIFKMVSSGNQIHIVDLFSTFFNCFPFLQICLVSVYMINFKFF